MTDVTQYFNGASGGINLIQSEYLDASTVLTSTGEDEKYVDVTITAVDITKAVPSFVGCGWASSNNSTERSGGGSIVSARLTSSTNLRLSCGANFRIAADFTVDRMSGRWTVVEAN